jgi:hypothetical protein
MSVPESIAWLESFAAAKPGQAPQIYATTLLGELTRLSEALNTCAHEVDERERLWREERAAHRARESAFDELEQKASSARDEWDATRVKLGGRLDHEREERTKAETMLRDVHHALLHQPELTREEIANTITSVVTPYPEGAKP